MFCPAPKLLRILSVFVSVVEKHLHGADSTATVQLDGNEWNV